jgi:hypothetical protein
MALEPARSRWNGQRWIVLRDKFFQSGKRTTQLKTTSTVPSGTQVVYKSPSFLAPDDKPKITSAALPTFVQCSSSPWISSPTPSSCTLWVPLQSCLARFTSILTECMSNPAKFAINSFRAGSWQLSYTQVKNASVLAQLHRVVLGSGPTSPLIPAMLKHMHMPITDTDHISSRLAIDY